MTNMRFEHRRKREHLLVWVRKADFSLSHAVSWGTADIVRGHAHVHSSSTTAVLCRAKADLKGDCSISVSRGKRRLHTELGPSAYARNDSHAVIACVCRGLQCCLVWPELVNV